MSFKVGDRIKVKLMREFNEEREPSLSLNKFYYIQSMNDTHIFVNNNFDNSYSICLDNIYIPNNPPKNDVEWLNRIQDNFKEGT